MDKLAAEGLRYNTFHTTALCSPTRAALITGRDHHSAATASITEAAIPAQSLAVSSLDDDSIIGEPFGRPLRPDAGQIVSKTDTTSH